MVGRKNTSILIFTLLFSLFLIGTAHAKIPECTPLNYDSDWLCMDEGYDTSAGYYGLSDYVVGLENWARHKNTGGTCGPSGDYYFYTRPGYEPGIIELQTPSLPWDNEYLFEFTYRIGTENQDGESFSVSCGGVNHAFLDTISSPDIWRNLSISCDLNAGENIITFKSMGADSVHFEEFRLTSQKGCEYIPFCGDYIINDGEECDDGDDNGQICSAGYNETCEYCSTGCEIETVLGPYCGDNSCDNGETYLTCQSDCEAPEPVCGNNIIEDGEECDEGDHNGPLWTQCTQYNEICNYCSTSCELEELRGPYCGDSYCTNDENYLNCASDCPFPELYWGDENGTKINSTNIGDEIYLWAENLGQDEIEVNIYEFDGALHDMGSSLTDEEDDEIRVDENKISLIWNGNALRSEAFTITIEDIHKAGDESLSQFYFEYEKIISSDLNIKYTPVKKELYWGDENGTKINSTNIGNEIYLWAKGFEESSLDVEIFEFDGLSHDFGDTNLDIADDKIRVGQDKISLTLNGDSLRSEPFTITIEDIINAGNEDTSEFYFNFQDYISNDLVVEQTVEPPFCGDGVCNGDEDYNSCQEDCEVDDSDSICGNGILEGFEECDDGNTENGDGCSYYCEIETKKKSKDKSEEKIFQKSPKTKLTSYAVTCIPTWDCSEWSECESGSKTRTCEVSNNCTSEFNKPSENALCQIREKSYVEEMMSNNYFLFGLALVAILALIIIILILFG